MPFLTPIPGLRAPALAFVAQGMVWASFAAQVPVIKTQIGASDAVFGVVFLLASLGAIASVWIAPVVDRWLGAQSVSVTSALLGVSFLFLAISPGVVSFVLVFLVLSAISGVSDIVMNARTSEVEAAERRSLMSLNHAIFSFAYAGTALATGLAREAGFSPLTVFGVVAMIILAMCVFMRAPQADLSGEVGKTDAAVPTGLVLIGGLVVLAAFFTESAVEGWSALHIERELGGNATAGAMGPAILGLTMGIGRLFGHQLARYFRDTTLIIVACLTAAIGSVLAALAGTPLVAQAGFGIMGLGISLVLPLAMGIVGRSVPPRQRVTALARASAIGYAAFVFGPAIMGGVAEVASLSASFLLVGVVMVGVAVFLIPLLARQL
ncbi:MFS transporter [Aestuariivita sp.]|jgi:predicted MFS family arabinose efflux permease|uniref:MFS transporter n=1 Tax=Aestuariivita sp. TaxID=1872407 RepID=UPI00216DDB97|nr:MFS transporter [Aestuariivita sp.]MCE8006354.1 MFS transporter [Aestuariivita sp.]